MKNWKTTIAATLIALTTLQIQLNAGALLSDWTTWVLPVAIQVFGYLAKDAGITGGAIALILSFGSLSLLPSCGVTYDGKGKPTFTLDPVAMARLIEEWQNKNDAKDANVKIVVTPKGDTIVATMPDGKVVTEVINPSVPVATPVTP